jgi:hypothetical protein
MVVIASDEIRSATHVFFDDAGLGTVTLSEKHPCLELLRVPEVEAPVAWF